MRESRPLPSWNGWISKKITFQIAMMMSGWTLSVVRSAVIHSMSSAIR